MPFPGPRGLAAAALALVLALPLVPHRPAPAAAAAEAAMPPMATYVLGLLRKGPEWSPERSPRVDSLQAGHMANMRKMWEAGRLVLAGPVDARDDLRGIWVFRADSAAEVSEMCGRDPSVRAGRLNVDLMTWWAPVGIGDGYRARLGGPGGKPDSMVARWLVLLKRGPKWSPQPDAGLQRAHVTHILSRVADGSSPAAGPVESADDLAAIAIYSTDSLTAWESANADPAVRARRLRVEMVALWSAYGNLPGER